MNLNFNQLSFLQRLLADRPDRRAAGPVALDMAENFGIGVLCGRHVQYAPAHLQRAGQLLTAGGYATEGSPREDQPGGGESGDPLRRRSDAHGQPNLSEKPGAAAPDANTVLIKPYSGICSLRGHALWAPDGGYLGVTCADAASVQCDVVMLVENLETFRHLDDYRTWLDPQGNSILAIWRGDKDRHVGDALRALGAHAARPTEPPTPSGHEECGQPGPGRVWCFFDFDPAGLGMADALHRRFGLEKLVLPPIGALESVVRRHDQRFLYAQQVQQISRILAQTQHPDIQAAWQCMRGMQIGLAQELMAGI